MSTLQERIIRRINGLSIDCPDCEDMYSDEQYTCTTCWCEGGQGKLNVMEYLVEHPEVLKQEKVKK